MFGVIIVVIIVMFFSYFIIRDAVAEGTLKALEDYDRLKDNQNLNEK